MRDSKIEWCDDTWQVTKGCTRDSTGCDHCYAATMSHRLAGMAAADLAAGKDPGAKRQYIGLTTKTEKGPIAFNGTIRLTPDALLEPFRWQHPRLVFVDSMADLFHRDVPDSYLDRVFGVMAATPHITYQVLTKRAERLPQYLGSHGRGLLVWADAYDAAVRAGADARARQLEHLPTDWPLPNVWIGTSVENQAAADRRIPHLLQTPAVVRFLSCEPLLGAVDLTRVCYHDTLHLPTAGDVPVDIQINALTGHGFDGWDGITTARIHWVIVGGESGPGARPMRPDWGRGLRDQCADADVPFLFKQWGQFGPPTAYNSGELAFDDGQRMRRYRSKAEAGRELDGRTHDAFPVVEATPCP